MRGRCSRVVSSFVGERADQSTWKGAWVQWVQWVCRGAAAKERGTTRRSRAGGDGERLSRPRDSLPEEASLCVAWMLPNF